MHAIKHANVLHSGRLWRSRRKRGNLTRVEVCIVAGDLDESFMAFDRPPQSQARPALEGEQARALLREAVASHRTTAFSMVAEREGLGRYRGYADMLATLDRLVERGGRLVQAGLSVQGRPLFALHLGKYPAAADTRTTVILSGVHPNEWIGIETHFALLEHLAGVDLGDRSIISFPIVNPDGVFQVETNLRAGRRRFVRHNARGVDLNRNFDSRWGHRGILQSLLPWVFRRGTRAASEPEVEAIAFALSKRRIDRALSLHRVWARRIARAADKRAYRAAPCSWWAWGSTAGGLELDWFHERHGAISLLVECSRGGFGVRPSRLLSPFAWFNPIKVEPVSSEIAQALLPFVKGHAP